MNDYVSMRSTTVNHIVLDHEAIVRIVLASISKRFNISVKDANVRWKNDDLFIDIETDIQEVELKELV
tara:strand:+ start:1218 stop:1421 length:204 start_codon:yes stop_codon:yes gene_type:complete